MPEHYRGEVIRVGKLYRRIYPDAAYFQNGVATSAVFRQAHDDEEGISANLADEISPEDVLAGHPHFGLAEISIPDIIQAGLTVTYCPEDGNPGHVLISGNLSSRKRKDLAAASVTLKAPELSPK